MTIDINDTFLMDRNEKNYRVPGEQIKDYFQPFEPGTIMVFYQSTPPTGWKNLNVEFTIPRTYNGEWTGDAHVMTGGNFQDILKSRRVPIPSHTHGTNRGSHTHSGGNAGHTHGGTESSHAHSSGNANHTHEYIIGGQEEKRPNDIFVRAPAPDMSKLHSFGNSSGGNPSVGSSGASGFGFSDAGEQTLSCSTSSGGLTVSYSGGSSAIDWAVKYCNVILCEKLV